MLIFDLPDRKHHSIVSSHITVRTQMSDDNRFIRALPLLSSTQQEEPLFCQRIYAMRWIVMDESSDWGNKLESLKRLKLEYSDLAGGADPMKCKQMMLPVYQNALTSVAQYVDFYICGAIIIRFDRQCFLALVEEFFKRN